MPAIVLRIEPLEMGNRLSGIRLSATKKLQNAFIPERYRLLVLMPAPRSRRSRVLRGSRADTARLAVAGRSEAVPANERRHGGQIDAQGGGEFRLRVRVLGSIEGAKGWAIAAQIAKEALQP